MVLDSEQFWDIADRFMEMIEAETGFPALIYDTQGRIIRATDQTRIGGRHAGADKILKGLVEAYAVTAEEAAGDPEVREGYSCPIVVDGRIVAGFAITGKLELAAPMAKIAVRMINAWIEKIDYQQRLEYSEEKYSKAFNSCPVWVVLSDLDSGRYLEVNETFLHTLGYAREEVVGRTSLDIGSWVDPADRTVVLNLIRTQGFVRGHEVKRRAKDGTVRTMLFSADAVEVAGGKCLLSVSQDITARKEMEEALRLSEKNLRTTLHSIGDAVIATDARGCITHMNPAAQKLTAWTAAEAVGRPLAEVFHIVHALTRQQERNPVERVLSSGTAVSLANHTILIARDGREYQIADSAAPIHVHGEQIAGVVLVFRDITEAYLQARRIRESERRFRELFNDAPIMYVITQNREGEPYVLEANAMFLDTLGYGRDEVVGTALARYYSEVSRQKMIRNDTYQEALKGTFRAAERCLVARDGRHVHTLLHSLPERDENGQVCGTRATYLDITALKEMEQEALRLESALLQAQKLEAIGTLAGGIAHDFNNILSAVIGYAQLSLTEVEQGSRLQQNLTQILTAGMRARDLVSQILAFSRHQDRELVPLHIPPLAKEALKLLRASLPATIEIVQEIAVGLDNVMADATQIQQIIMNLCTNAAQAMEAHGGRLTVRLDQVNLTSEDRNRLPELQPGPHLRLSVQDTGPGIPEKVLDRIFHPFFTTKPKGKGTGLGLSVVHGIINGLKGAITVSSQAGRGSDFRVYLPAIKRQVMAGDNAPAPWPTGSERVLLVDDEPFVMEIGQKTLEKLGYQVTACGSSLQALELFKNAPDDFDLVVSDITMPKMTGDELAARLLQVKKDLPIILCTGFSDRLSGEQAAAMGAKALLMKPVVPAELAHTVRKVLGKQDKIGS